MPDAKTTNPLQSLTKKAGPLPVWAWAALILVGFYVYSHRSGSNIAAPTSSTSPAVNTTGPSAGDGTGTPPDLTSQLSGLGTSLSDIAANQSVLAGYNDSLLAGQQAIWDSLGSLSSSYALATPAYVGGGANGSGSYNTSWNAASTPVVYSGGNVGGFTGPNPSPTGYSPPDSVVGNAAFGGQYSSPKGSSKAKLA